MTRGPKVTCTCGKCKKCKVREKVRRHRADVKMQENALNKYVKQNTIYLTGIRS